jgi:hypothetical protein
MTMRDIGVICEFGCSVKRERSGYGDFYAFAAQLLEDLRLCTALRAQACEVLFYTLKRLLLVWGCSGSLGWNGSLDYLSLIGLIRLRGRLGFYLFLRN